MSDLKRVERELEQCCKGPDIFGVGIKAKDENLEHLIGTISGLIGTPYEGGVFEIDINLLGDYPSKPPQMKFITKVWHPNINSKNGFIMPLDTLNRQWSPLFTLKTALLSVQELLSVPQPDVPQDAVVATQYIEDYETFVATARRWTATFAIKSSKLRSRDKVEKLTELGFPKALVEKVLESVDEDEILALHELANYKRCNYKN